MSLSTSPPRAGGASNPAPSSRGPGRSRSSAEPGSARRIQNAEDSQVLVAATATIAGGVLLTMLPMHSVFTDWDWFTASAVCAAPYVAIALAFRWSQLPRWWHIVLGLAASLLALVWLFLPQHLYLGVLPTPSSLGDIRALLAQAHETMQADHAPLPSTGPLRLLTASATVGLVALTDVLAVLMRRPLLASAPLLEVLAVASATSSSAASPLLFAAAAIGFLLILVAGTRLQDRDWGPSVDGSAGRLGGARRMAITGIIAALIVPLFIPAVSVNLLARATHHNGTGSGSGSGARIELNDTADLSGSLRRGTPVDLFRVQVAPADKPFYIRQAVLDQFTNSGWQQSASDASRTDPLYNRRYPIAPQSVTGDPITAPSTSIQATFTILALGGNNLPLLANPKDLDPMGGLWDETTASVRGASLFRNITYNEQAQQIAPSEDQLRAAPNWSGSGNSALDSRFVHLDPQPSAVTDLANRLTAGLTSDYDKAKAISDYFTDPKNGFVYSLDTAPSDGRSALVTFLDKKRGFCQQFAAAAAVLMREAGLPTRVVLGYTHQAPDGNGVFTVTTSDAHAWVEVYFAGIGWVPFDPTPLGGTDVSREVTLPWATHASTAPTTSSTGTTSAVHGPSQKATPSSTGASGLTQATAVGDGNLWWEAAALTVLGIAVLVLLVLAPHLLRQRQRRRRYRQAVSSGNPEPLWQELAASAFDRGVLWPETVTVGQVPRWLARQGVDERGAAAIASVAGKVELARFSVRGSGQLTDEAVLGVDEALRRWARRAERRQRLRQWLLPRSLLKRSDSRVR